MRSCPSCSPPCIQPLGLTSQHVSATFYLSQLPGCSMLFYLVRWTDSFILSGAVMGCPCGCIAIRLLFCGTHHHYIHRFIAHGAASQDLARHHACIKKRLRTSQDYSGRMASDLQGHSESFRVIPCLSATTLMEIQEVQVGKSARQ